MPSLAESKVVSLPAYRALVALAAGVTILISWGLWEARDAPPMLPLLQLPRLSLGIPLLAALALVVVQPRLGVLAYSVTLGYAILIDQTRIQPELISFAILMAATLPGENWRLIGRVHLITMWSWAGVNKLSSPDFASSMGPAIAAQVFPEAPQSLLALGGFAVAFAEIGIAILALLPRTRRVAGAAACVLHIGILVALSQLDDPNLAVWPWNVTLAIGGMVFFWRWPDRLTTSFGTAHRAARLSALFLAIVPAGFHVGLVDAYLSHNLYSSLTPLASTVPPMPELFGVPFPPAHRLYEQHFQLTCLGGQTLRIVDRRPWFRLRGIAQRSVPCRLVVAPTRPPLPGARRPRA